MKRGFLFVILLILSLQVTSADSFTGVGNKTTGTFNSVEYTKIEWSTVASNDFDLFSAYIYDMEYDLVYDDIFDGPQGTTYLYDSGEYYFDILAANLDSWTITTTATSGEYLENNVSFYGIGNVNTKLFECFGDCLISWETVASNEFDMFIGYIEELGGIIFTDLFDGSSGSTHLYETGIFYIQILAANIDQWGINVQIAPPTTTEDPTTTEWELSNTTVDIEPKSEEEDTNAGFGFLTMVGMALFVIIRKRKNWD